jgi:hypothetical protein
LGVADQSVICKLPAGEAADTDVKSFMESPRRSRGKRCENAQDFFRADYETPLALAAIIPVTRVKVGLI